MVVESVAAGADRQQERPGDFIRRAHQRIAAGEVGAARSELEAAQRRWPDAANLLFLEARILEAEGALDAAGAKYRQAAAALTAEIGQTSTPDLALSLAHAQTKCGDLVAAEAALDIARRLSARPLNVLRAERAIAFARKDSAAMRRLGEAIVAAPTDVAPQDYVALAIACRDLGDLDAAAAAVARARERDPTNVEAARVSAWVATRRGDVETAIASQRAVAALAPANPRPAAQLVRLLVLSGRVAEGGRELDRALQTWPTDPALRAFALVAGFRSVEEIDALASSDGGSTIDRARESQMRKLVRAAPASAALLRPVIVDDKSRDVIVGHAPQSDTAVLVFSALNDTVSMPLPVFDRYLAALGLTAIYVKDFNRLFYLAGIASLGTSLVATLNALGDLCQRLNVRRLCALGSSAGGFAAVRYGVELGAERVFSFSSETHDRDRDLSKVDQGIAMIRRRLAGHVAKGELDLKPLLLSRPTRPEIDLYYPADAARETAQALHLTGIEGVTLRPVAGCDDHELLRWLALNDDLTAILKRLTER